MSDQDCRNDCTVPLRFPRRPGTQPPSGSGVGCSCCGPTLAGISADNRPSLARFNYRIGSYGSIREFLFHQINETPNLQNWTHRAADDPAVALLEGASILGDILTFYQETYANEAFLRTATWRESIADLVRLLGYRLSPAVGGKAVFAFEIKKDEPVLIPAGFPLKAPLEAIPKPSEFESTAPVTAYPWLSQFNLYRPLEDGAITPATAEFFISYPEQLLEPINLKVGDRLMVGDPDLPALFGTGSLPNAEILIVDSITELHGRKTYKIKGNLKRTSNAGALFAFRLGRTFHHFGYNSPALIVDANAPVSSTATVSGSTTTTSSTIPKLFVPQFKPLSEDLSDSTVSLVMSHLEFPLDAEVKDLAANTAMIFEFGYLNSYRETSLPHISLIRKITDVRSSALTWGAIGGTASIVTISESLNSAIIDPYVGGENPAYMYLTDALIHEVTSPLFTLLRAKSETLAASGNKLHFYGTVNQAETLKNRRVMVAKAGAEPEILVIAEVNVIAPAGTEDIPQLHEVTLSADVAYADFPNQKPFVTVFGNLVDADEGKTQPETPIGSGDETLLFQNFKLPKAPLTYHLVPANTPCETPEIEIYVNGRQWTEVDSLFGRGPEEQIYIVREDDAGNSWVQFGDGKTGARLTSGANNVTAVYRLGNGAYGPLKDEAKVQASAKLKNLGQINMPAEASGGAPPESGDNARNAAPGKVQSLGRIVSLKDFELEAAAIPGVASASAAWQLVDNVPAVVVTALMETGRGTEFSAVRETLEAYNRERGSARHAIDVVSGKRLYVAVGVQYVLKPTYRADLVEPLIRLALGQNLGKATREEDQTGLFSLRRRRFGGREYASSIAGVVQNVEGVLWAKTVAFMALNDSDDPDGIVLPSTSTLDPIVSCDSGHIMSLYEKHLAITAVREGGT